MGRPLSPRAWFTLAPLCVAVLGGAAFFFQERFAREEARARADTARAVREVRARTARRFESASLMPEGLRGLALGQAQADVLQAHASAEPKANRRDDEHVWYEDVLPNGARLLLGFSREDRTLAQVQVASVLPSVDAIGAHFTAMNDAYGTPTGVWDCPDTEGVPTRRFTWRRAQTTLADVFLIYGSRVSVTLYIAATDDIGRSLERSRCHPVSQAELARFPVVPGVPAAPIAPAVAPSTRARDGASAPPPAPPGSVDVQVRL